MFLQISLTYARNSRGPNTLPCGTPEVTLTSSDNCPSTLTLCERPKRNPCTHKTTLKSTPVAAIFVSSLSYGTKSKAFEKYIIIASVPTPLSSESAISWQTVTTWLPHHLFIIVLVRISSSHRYCEQIQFYPRWPELFTRTPFV